jgi:hypothetical protein
MKRPVVVPSVLALVVLLAACSDHSPVAPGAYSRIPCRPPVELAAMVVGTPFEPNAMRTALQHAGNHIGPTLGDGADVRALRDAIGIVDTDIGIANMDGACRLLTIAYGALKELPDTPATYPDRDAIRLILALTAQSLADVMGP